MIKKHDLTKIIYRDLFIYGRVQLILLLLIMLSAILVVFLTYQTRSLIIEQEKLLLEKNKLDVEWSKLMFEKEKLSNSIRIESIAINELNMRYVDPILDRIYE